MLIYLLKATLVWGFSLLLFEMLFRRLNTHAANRAYLLGTLALGLLLPLISLPAPEAVQHALPVKQVFILPRADANVSVSNSTTEVQPAVAVTIEDWLQFLWLTGAAIALSSIASQGRKLFLLARRGKKLLHCSRFVVVETSVPHGPFSFFNRIFVQDRAAYSVNEWRMLIAHEGCHIRQWHSLDVVILTLLKTLLWFHPAIHWYSRRLRIVHEYLADATAALEPSAYGCFLLEQSSLHRAPILALSLFHSPIKSRIAMLIRSSPTARARAVYLAIVPLFASLLLLCCKHEQPSASKTSSGQPPVAGHTFEMSDLIQQPATFLVGGEESGEESYINIMPRPVKMDGQPIYSAEDLTKAPAYAGPARNIMEDLFNRIKPSLQKLNDGGYMLDMPAIVVDEAGKVVYQDEANLFSDVQSFTVAGDGTESHDTALFKFTDGKFVLRLPEVRDAKADVPDDIRQDVVSTMHKALNTDIKFSPGELNGKPVIAYLGSPMEVRDKFSLPTLGPVVVVVKEGKAQLVGTPN